MAQRHGASWETAMNPLQRFCWTLLLIPAAALAATVTTLAAAAICGVALTACPFVVFWAVWKPSRQVINEGKLP